MQAWSKRLMATMGPLVTAVFLVALLLAVASLPVGIVLAQNRVVSRRVGFLLVALGVPVAWPGLWIAALLALHPPRVTSVLDLPPFLLPNAVLLLLVGGIASGIYLLATRARNP